MKNNKNSILGLLFISLSMYGLTAAAVTPDGQTPAEETICDPLKADGVSKGLYGLCVAFCEAHDFADENIPTTEAELDSLAANAPSGKILANYNKRKQESDPPMPCIVVEPPCPCFSAAQLGEIDGYLDGAEIGTFCPTNNPASVIAAEPSDLLTTVSHAPERFINVNRVDRVSTSINKACLM